MPLASGITSVTLDRAFFVLSAAVVSIVGLLAVLIVLPLPHTLSLYAGLFAFTLLGVVLANRTCGQKPLAGVFRNGADRGPDPLLQRLDRTQAFTDSFG